MADEGIMILEFPELATTVSARLTRELNPGLFDALRAAMPFTGIASHSVVSGANITCWTPVYSVEPVQAVERIDKMPVGRVFASGSGNKILFKYSHQSEWVNSPILGMVEGEELERLQRIAPYIWESVFMTKRLYHISFSWREA